MKLCLLCKKCKTIKMETQLVSIPEQIKKALDGRTQRWLSFECRIPEADLSRKMNENELEFTEDELKRIEERLSFKIDNPKK